MALRSHYDEIRYGGIRTIRNAVHASKTWKMVAKKLFITSDQLLRLRRQFPKQFAEACYRDIKKNQMRRVY